MKTISIPFYNRWQVLKKVIASFNAAQGHEQWTAVFNGEPNCFIPSPIDAANVLGTNNQTRLGCWANTFMAANFAMAHGSDLNLYLEDDYLISKDALLLVDSWAARPDSQESVLCLRRPHDMQDLASPGLVSRCQSGLFGCGFAWRKELWPLVRECWWKRAPMWDISMEQLPVPQWRPLVNRSHGIGINGTHTCNGGADLNLFGPMFQGCVDKFVFVED